MNINKKHKGAYSELRAILWFLKNGYEVYRNVSQHGICDMIVTKNGELKKVDVKTAIVSKHNCSLHCAPLTEDQKENGIVILMVDIENDHVIWRDESGTYDFVPCVRECRNCGEKMNIDQKRRENKIFCRSACRGAWHCKNK